MAKRPTDSDNRRNTAAGRSSKSAGATKPPPRRPRRYIKPERDINWYEKAEGQIAIASSSMPVEDDEPENDT